MGLHDSTTVLLEEADDLGEVLLDLLLVIHLVSSLLLLLVVLLVLLVALLLRRVALLLLALLVAQRVGSLVLRLSMMRLVVLLRLTISSRGYGGSTSEVYVDSAFIVLGMVLETLLLADLLDTRLDLLDVVDRVVTFADDAVTTIRRRNKGSKRSRYLHMQMVLAGALCVLDSLFQNLLGLFNKLTVEVNGITVDSSYSVVLAEDVFRSLSIVVVGLLTVVLCFLRQVVSGTSISTRIRLLRFGRTMLTFAVFLSRKVSQSIVLGLGVARLLVVEGWGFMSVLGSFATDGGTSTNRYRRCASMETT